MSTLNEKMEQELQILFHALCDGLRQEMRQRHSLSHLIPSQDFSLTKEREIGIASSLAWHLRLAGFVVQIDAYIAGGDPKWRPDFGIWLPASKEYIYLELKQTAWGNYSKEYYSAGAIKDIKKLNNKDIYPPNKQNGLIAFGFSYNPEPLGGRLWERFKKLSQDITGIYPYENIGLECVDFQGMDKQSSYAVIALWFRKEWNNS